MSFQDVNDVLRYSKAEGIDKFILICLASYSNDEHQAYPSVKTLAKDTGLSERTIQNSTKRLIELGELSLVEEGGYKGGKRWANTYRIRVSEIHPPVQQMHPVGVTDSPTPVQEVHPNQSLTINHTTKKGFSLEDAKRLPLPESLQTSAFAEAWNNIWLPHRFSHHSGKPSQLTIELTLKRCAKFGPVESVRLIEKAAAGGWQGIPDPEPQKFSNPTSADGEIVDAQGFICDPTCLGGPPRRRRDAQGNWIRAGGQG